MEDKYSYEVHPRIPIKNVIPGKGIFRPTVLDLTKDEVVKCLKCGPVFRNFARGNQVQVTLYNIDELHVAHYVAPSKKVIDPSKKTNVSGIIVPKKEFVPHIIAPAKKEESEAPEEEKVEEAPIVEKPVEDVHETYDIQLAEEKVEEAVPEAPVEEVVEVVEELEASEEEKVEEVTDEEVEESVEESEEAEEAPVAGQPNPNNRRKKKHH